MPKRNPAAATPPTEPARPAVPLVWVKASYHLHSFSYRDPRVASSSAVGLPVLSPTAVLLGVVSTLFNLGFEVQARGILEEIDRLRAIVDPPKGAIFFRAFHQVRRYVSGQNKGSAKDFVPSGKLGLTNINQSTREHALVDGEITLFVGAPEQWADSVATALRHRSHLGSRDSICSLIDDVSIGVPEPVNVLYLAPEQWQTEIPMNRGPVTILSLSRFKTPFTSATVGDYWWLSGSENTEIVPYLVQGKFRGTTRGKVYIKGDTPSLLATPEGETA